MTCIDYVLSHLTTSCQHELINAIESRDYVKHKESLYNGDVIIFIQHFHIGFGKINEYFDIETNEYSDNCNITRNLSLFDESLHVVRINIKFGKIKPQFGERG